MNTQPNTTPAPANAATDSTKSVAAQPEVDFDDPSVLPLKPLEYVLLDAFRRLNPVGMEKVLALAEEVAHGEQPAPEQRKVTPRRSFPAMDCIGYAVFSRLAAAQLLSYEAINDPMGDGVGHTVSEIIAAIEYVLPELDFAELHNEYDAAFAARQERAGR